MNFAIVFAGGSGERMGSSVPKQYLELDGKPVLVHTLELFERHPEIDGIYLVVGNAHIAWDNVVGVPPPI